MELIKACDIANAADRPYLVQNLIPQEAVVLFSGPSGAGKSALLMYLATAIAERRHAFGSLAIDNPDGRSVLYVNGELHPTNFKQYAERAARSHSFSEASPRVLVATQARGALSFGAGTLPELSGLSAAMECAKPILVILDTQRALFNIGENNQREVGVIAKSLWSLSAVHGCTIVLAHHTRKPGPFPGGPQTAVAGSGYFVGAVDVHIALHARDGRFAHKLEVVKDRMARDAGKRAFSIRVSLSNDTSTITLGPDSPADTNKDAVLLAKMREHGPLTRRELENIGIRRRSFERLRDEVKIVPHGTGKAWLAA